MSAQEVKQLRKLGNLSEALQIALTDYEQDRSSEEAIHNLAMVYDAQCEQAAENGDLIEFEHCFGKISELGVLLNDSVVNDTLCWRFKVLLKNTDFSQVDVNDVCDRLWSMMQYLNVEKPSSAYSMLLRTFFSVAMDWNNFVDFCDWWNFENFTEADYKCSEFDAFKMHISVVELAYVLYAKKMLANDNVAFLRNLIPAYDNLGKSHPDMWYPCYYAGKMMLRIAGNKPNDAKPILEYVRKNYSTIWAWRLLAETIQDDYDTHIACLLRAASIKTSKKELAGVYLMLFNDFKNAQDYAGARKYLDKYIKSRHETQTPIAWQVKSFKKQSWYEEAADKEMAYDVDYMTLTNKLIFSDLPETDALITYVNTEKSIISVLIGVKKTGFFRCANTQDFVAGMPLKLRLIEESDEPMLKVASVRVVPSISNDFCRVVKGDVSANPARTAYFLNVGRESFFIPFDLISQNGIEVGDEVSSLIAYDYNKKKEEWGWKCVTIEK